MTPGADWRAAFEKPKDLTYLDSATYGLPSRSCVDALRAALDGWQHGTASWQDDWETCAESCRASFSTLVNGDVGDVALLPAVSLATAIVATAVPRGGEVLLEEGEFRSIVYPFLVAESRGLLEVREAPRGRLADRITANADLVALSHVQSEDGWLADVADVSAAAHDVGALVYLDATHSAGAREVDVGALDVDFLACAAYKWLCSPRGVAFLWTRKDHLERLVPIAAGWRASPEHLEGGYYGSPLRLAADASRLDLSLAWHAWVGAAESLRALTTMPRDELFAVGYDLATQLARELDLPKPQSSIVSVPVHSATEARAALTNARVKVTTQEQRLRISPHFYNDRADIDRAVEVIRPLVQPA